MRIYQNLESREATITFKHDELIAIVFFTKYQQTVDRTQAITHNTISKDEKLLLLVLENLLESISLISGVSDPRVIGIEKQLVNRKIDGTHYVYLPEQ